MERNFPRLVLWKIVRGLREIEENSETWLLAMNCSVILSRMALQQHSFFIQVIIMHTLYFIVPLIAYYALHSILAAYSVKAGLSKILPQRYYRLMYNLLATVLLIGIIILYFMVEKAPLWEPNLMLSLLGVVPILVGINWVVQAMKRYNLEEFIGLEQLRMAQPPQHNKLIIRGLNGKVRHPMYFGTLLIVWGVLPIFPTDAMLGFSMISTIYLIIGSRLEEEKLVAQFGEAYRRYQREVPMLLPFGFMRKIK